MEECEAAAKDLDAAMALDPPASLLRAINSVRGQVRGIQKLAVLPENRVGDQTAAIGLVHEEQTLRLFFKHRPARRVAFGMPVPVSIYMANEFGLWRRADYPGGDDDLRLSCQIIPQPCDHQNDPAQAIEVEIEDASNAAVFRPGTSCRASFNIRLKRVDGVAAASRLVCALYVVHSSRMASGLSLAVRVSSPCCPCVRSLTDGRHAPLLPAGPLLFAVAPGPST